MTATIKDIAKRLGISVTAVSKALNDKDDISDQLKIRVKKVAEELDYSANTIAKRLVTNKSNTLGVFMFSRVSQKLDSFVFQFIAGILEEANKNDYDILLFSTDSDLLNEKSYIKLCKERRVEGAVLFGVRLDDPHIDELKSSPLPISIIDTDIEGKNIYYVSTDNRTGVNKAMDYLWRLGHRRIAMINGHEKAQVSKFRYNAFRQYLRERDSFESGLVFPGDFSQESGYYWGREILKMEQRPTAVFAASDLMALGAIQAFKEAGLHLPHDMSIIGFDNLSSSEFVEPGLTTVSQDGIKMGKEAAKLLLDRIAGRGSEQKVVLQPELIIRDSCQSINQERG
ncbi:MAG: LacI family transcriptional regulator [Halanaerobiales bacterium]|nr:LacI family transcriptional regulator [Halanaerobiales bacterium]